MEEKITLKNLKTLLLVSEPKNFIKDDLYEFAQTVDFISDYLENSNSPKTIGIYGDWGSGKTSLKNFIIENICERKKKNGSKIFPLPFNAWEYEQQAGILIPLLHKLVKLSGLGESKAKKIFSVLAISFSDIFLKLSTGSLLGINDITSFEKYANENFFQYSQYMDKLSEGRNDFKNLVAEINKKKKSDKIVFFIDELDRCNPENAIKLLESIKNFFNVEGCIFVILVDDEILASYINKKYEDTKMDGHSYLEKIINVKFRVPKFTIKQIKNYFTFFDTDLTNFQTISKFFNPRKLSKLYEKSLLWEGRTEILDSMWNQSDIPKIIQKLDSPERRYRLSLIVLVNECYPNLYNILTTASDDYWSRLRAKTNQYKGDQLNFAYEEIKTVLKNTNHDEILFLGFLFNKFENKQQFEVFNTRLKNLKII